MCVYLKQKEDKCSANYITYFQQNVRTRVQTVSFYYFVFSFFQVAWLRVDTQTILTIQNHVITKNHRVGITYSEHKTWQLRIKDIRESDRGWYMCQINTDPMKSQTGFLDVVG